MENWYFERDATYWWDVGAESICFDGYLEGERWVFAVTQIALNDYYGTDDTPEDADSNYINNMDHVESVVARFASTYEANDEPPNYFIDSEKFQEFA